MDLWLSAVDITSLGGNMLSQSTLAMTISMINFAGILLNGRLFHIPLAISLVLQIYISTPETFSSLASVLISIPYFMPYPHMLLLKGSNFKSTLKRLS